MTSTIRQKAGTVFGIQVPEKASTGYMWRVINVSDISIISGFRTDSLPTGSSLGRELYGRDTSNRTFSFNIDIPGETNVIIGLVHIWENPMIPNQVQTYHLVAT
jgi:predicted secreted protein